MSWLTKRRVRRVIIPVIAVLILYQMISMDSSTFYKKIFTVKKCPTGRNNQVKLILFTTIWWHEHFPFIEEANQFCPRCVFTENKTMWNSSDAVIFHARMLYYSNPQIFRPEGQIWVLMSFETLLNGEDSRAFKQALQYDGKFNWTLTYRQDSDIFTPYGKFISVHDMPRPDTTETWAFTPGALGNYTYANYSYVLAPSADDISKRKMVAWITSRCQSPSKRELIAIELAKYVEVDVYGKCGKLKCNVPKTEALTGVDCRVQIARDYKFYLAFESSICEDYVTEKFFDTTLTEMVPIVYGGADYAKMFPEKSFINVGDFGSVEDLADYLIYLDNNVPEYLKYFEWRNSYWVQTNRFVTGYCDLCNKLWYTTEHECDKEPHTYTSVYHWWLNNKNYLSNNQSACRNPEDRFPELFSTLI